MNLALNVKMDDTYKIEITHRGGALEYSDASGSYGFNAIPYKGIWEVSLLCYKGEKDIPEELTSDESKIIIPRLIKFIESKRRFGIFGKKYKAKFVVDPERYTVFQQ